MCLQGLETEPKRERGREREGDRLREVQCGLCSNLCVSCYVTLRYTGSDVYAERGCLAVCVCVCVCEWVVVRASVITLYFYLNV